MYPHEKLKLEKDAKKTKKTVQPTNVHGTKSETKKLLQDTPTTEQ